jgi:hypothetical protein
MELQSGFVIVEEGDTRVSLPPITLYNKTDDISKLVMNDVRLLLDYGTDSVQVVSVYSFSNPTEEIITVTLNDNSEVPFIKSPEGSSGLRYETTQNSEPFLQMQNGFAIPPSESSYELVALVSVPKANEFIFSQEYVLPTATVTILVPEGVTIESDQLKDLGIRAMENFNFHLYELDGVGAGEQVRLTISGTPEETTGASTPGEVNPNQNLLIGVGVLGAALILAGAWMYLRDRNRVEEVSGEEDERDEFESSEAVMDAIIALDDLHRARKISDEGYQKRRAELKEILKGKM